MSRGGGHHKVIDAVHLMGRGRHGMGREGRHSRRVLHLKQRAQPPVAVHRLVVVEMADGVRGLQRDGIRKYMRMNIKDLHNLASAVIE